MRKCLGAPLSGREDHSMVAIRLQNALPTLALSLLCVAPPTATAFQPPDMPPMSPPADESRLLQEVAGQKFEVDVQTALRDIQWSSRRDPTAASRELYQLLARVEQDTLLTPARR